MSVCALLQYENAVCCGMNILLMLLHHKGSFYEISILKSHPLKAKSSCCPMKALANITKGRVIEILLPIVFPL